MADRPEVTLGYGILFMDGAAELGMKKRDEQRDPPFKSVSGDIKCILPGVH